MKMNSAVAVLFTLLLSAPVCASAEVWRCKEGDRTVFSDSPCPKTGMQIDEHKLQGNTLQAEPVYRSPDGRPEYETGNDGRVIRRADREAAQSASPSGGRNVCPSDQDIRNMQVRANSNSLGPEQKQFMYDEIRRARQCAAGQGAYTAKDWAESRDAQNAQSSLAGGRKERINAEGVHSAADPVEGDRIATRRAQEDAARAYAEAERRRRSEAIARVQAESIITSCDARGCYSTGGTYYRRDGAGRYIGPNGFCRRVGESIRCN